MLFILTIPIPHSQKEHLPHRGMRANGFVITSGDGHHRRPLHEFLSIRMWNLESETRHP